MHGTYMYIHKINMFSDVPVSETTPAPLSTQLPDYVTNESTWHNFVYQVVNYEPQDYTYPNKYMK